MPEHSEIWEFGPDKEFADFNSAITALNEYFAGDPFQYDQFLLGTPYSTPYRDTEQLNDKNYPFVFNGHRLVISSSNERIKFTGKRLVPNNTFFKYIEDQEPSGPIWKTDWLQTQPITSYNELYENGVLLTEKTSIEDLTPGSYFVDIDRIMYVHSKDSSRVRITGIYEFTINNNIFKWVCFDLNDNPRNLSIIDVDLDSTLQSSIKLDNNSKLSSAFDFLKIVNCRFKTNHRFIELTGAVNGVTVKNSSFIEDDIIITDSGILMNDVGNVNVTYNYFKTYDESLLLRISGSGLNVNDNILCNGSIGLTSSDEVNIKRNLFRRDKISGNCALSIRSQSPVNNIIGNAFLGAINNNAYIDTNNYLGTYNVQNNTIWSEEGDNQLVIDNVNPLSTINSKLNLISINGDIYSGSSLGDKIGNVYIGDFSLSETKLRIAPFRNVFSKNYSYSSSLESIDIVPIDDICKSVLRRALLEPEDLDITGSVTQCYLTAGCIQVSAGSEESKWLPDWIFETSLPDGMLFNSHNFYASKNRRFNYGCETPPEQTYPPSIELIQELFAPVFTPSDNPTYSVEISIIPIDAVIRVTYDGSDPDEFSDIYTVPILTSSDYTLKARGFLPGLHPGPISSINLLMPVSDPYFTLIGDILSITDSSGYGEIHYTDDGSEPTLSSPIYSTPFNLTENITYKAKSFKIDGTRMPSNTITYIYEIPSYILAPDVFHFTEWNSTP